mgnify:FL=1
MKALQKLLLSVVIAVVVPAGNAQMDNVPVTISGFKTRGTGESGRVAWIVTGDKARLHGQKAELHNFEVVFHPRNPSRRVQVSSPECTFYRAAGRGHSAETLLVQGETFALRGKGYDVLVDEQKLHIRSRVCMYIRHERTPLGQARESDGRPDRGQRQKE